LTEVAATAFANIGWRFYIVFIVVPACGLPILWTFPETKGLTLEEIAVQLGDVDSLDTMADSSGNEKNDTVRGSSIIPRGAGHIPKAHSTQSQSGQIQIIERTEDRGKA
jgi:hypothetical protein